MKCIKCKNKTAIFGHPYCVKCFREVPKPDKIEWKELRMQVRWNKGDKIRLTKKQIEEGFNKMGVDFEIVDEEKSECEHDWGFTPKIFGKKQCIKCGEFIIDKPHPKSSWEDEFIKDFNQVFPMGRKIDENILLQLVKTTISQVIQEEVDKERERLVDLIKNDKELDKRLFKEEYVIGLNFAIGRILALLKTR